MKTNLEKNQEIAKMLGWIYLSNLDINNGKYHESIKAGWYTKLPKKLILKLTNHLYIGRNHHCLQFDKNWNRLMLAIDFIEKIGETKEKYGILVDITTTYIKVGDKAIDLKLQPMNKKEATFEAIYLFAKQFNEKE
jgi:hypothetical protein